MMGKRVEIVEAETMIGRTMKLKMQWVQGRDVGCVCELAMVDACDHPCQDAFLPGRRILAPLILTEMTGHLNSN